VFALGCRHLDVAEDFVGEFAHFVGWRDVGPGGELVMIGRLRGACRTGSSDGGDGALFGKTQRRFNSGTLVGCSFFRTACAIAVSLDHGDPVRGVYCNRFPGVGKTKIRFFQPGAGALRSIII